MDKKQRIRSPWYEQIWRVTFTGIAFLLFGLGGLFLSIFIFPFYNLVVRDIEKRRYLAQRTIRFSFRLFVKFLELTGVIEFQIEGLDILKKDKNVIIAANHPTLIDYVLLASQMPYCDCIVKTALSKNFFLKGVVKAADYILNDDEIERFLDLCQSRLDRGGVLLVFPEGTRTTAGSALKLQRGTANIALRTQTDIRLVTITITHPMLTKEMKWYTIPPFRPRFTIKVEDKLAIEPYLDRDESISIIARQLTDDLTVAMNENIDCLERRLRHGIRVED